MKILQDEHSLLQRAASGDQNAFRKLFEKYWDRIFSNALYFLKSPDLAQDLAQEVFIRIWIRREQLAEVQQFENYLHRVSKNLIVDELRKKLPSILNLDSCFNETEDLTWNAHKALEFKELEKQINNAVNQLPMQMQTAFKLSRFEGLTHQQIACVMNISKVTSQNYIARAITSIKKAVPMSILTAKK